MHTVDTISELLAILRSRDAGDLQHGLQMLVAQLRARTACAPLEEYARGKMPEWINMWDAFHGNPALSALVLEASALAIRSAACDALVTAITSTYLKFLYRAINGSQDVVAIQTLLLLAAVNGSSRRAADRLYASFDFSVLPKSLGMRKKRVLAEAEPVQSVRQAFVAFICSFLQHASMETKLGIAEMKSLTCDAILGHLFTDPFGQILALLDLLRTHVVDVRMKKLPLTFFGGRGEALAHLLKLLEHDKPEVVQAVESFLTHLLVEVLPSKAIDNLPDDDAQTEVRNRLVLDFVNTLHPLESVMQQRMAVKILGAAPDVFVPHFRALHRSLGFTANDADTRWIAQMGYLIQAAQLPVHRGNAGIEFLCPSSRVLWTRMLASESQMVRFLTFSLLEGLLGRVYRACAFLETHQMMAKRDGLLAASEGLLPDFQTLLANAGSVDALVVKTLKWYYVLYRPAFDPTTKFLCDDSIEGTFDLAAALPYIVDPFTAGGWFTRACRARAVGAVQQMIGHTGLTTEIEAVALHALAHPEKVREAVVRLRSQGLVSEPLHAALGIEAAKEAQDSSASSAVPSAKKEEAFFKFACHGGELSKVAVANELLDLVDVNAAWTGAEFAAPSSAEELRSVLFEQRSAAAWLSLLAWLVEDPAALDEAVLRRLVETRLISNACLQSLPCVPVLLVQFMRCMAWCRLKERYQVHVLLAMLLAGDSSRAFVACALSIMLQPAHVLYVPVSQYALHFVTSNAVDELPFFEEALGLALIPVANNAKADILLSAESLWFACQLAKTAFSLGSKKRLLRRIKGALHFPQIEDEQASRKKMKWMDPVNELLALLDQ